jgi:sigma-B regulation protein RsbU (phosphoserine phosphatase)
MSDRLLRIEIPAKAEALRELRTALVAALDRAHVDAESRDRLVLAVHEAACNVIRHAYGDGCEGRMRVDVARERGALRFSLRDYAPPCDPARIRPRDLSVCRPGGLGINFIDDTMDSWRLRPVRHRRGNVLVMRKRIRPHADAPGSNDDGAGDGETEATAVEAVVGTGRTEGES